MKKIFISAAAAVSLFALSLGIAACGGADDSSDDKGTLYSIQAPAASDIYTITGLPGGAYEGDTVTFTVTLTDPENSALLGVSADDDELTAGANGSYTFTMPADAVTISVDARAFSEVLSDGGVTFDGGNVTTIAKGADDDWYWDDDNNMVYCHTFDIGLDWGNYTTSLSRNCEIISSDQSVIPDEAISYMPANYGNGNMFHGIEVRIDTNKINPGSTWLEMYFQSDNSSSDNGKICVKITVSAEGSVVKAEKWTETVVFTLNPGIDTETLYFHFRDNDYAASLDSEQDQYFYAGDYTVEDNTVTLTIEYVQGHEYSISVGFNDGTGNSLVLGENVVNGGAYQEDILTFERTGVTIGITVFNELWQP